MKPRHLFLAFVAAFFAALFLMPEYDFHGLSQGVYYYKVSAKSLSGIIEKFEPVFFKEGMYGSVMVEEDDCDGLGCDKSLYTINGKTYELPFGKTFSGNAKHLSVNGATQCSSLREDMVTETLLGGLPIILHDNPKNALNIGLGCGVSLGVLEEYPLQSIDSIEIDSAVVEASSYFNDVHGNALDDPRSNLYLTDARNYLLTTEKKYDIIVNTPPVPLSTEISNLYSVEFMQLMKERLNEKGIVAQYLTVGLFNSPENDLKPFKVYYKTFQSVFPHVRGYLSYTLSPGKVEVDGQGNIVVSEYTLNPGEMVLIGSQKPISLSQEGIDKRMRQRMPESFAKVKIESLKGYYMFNEKDLEGLADETIPLNTDDMPIIEFAIARNARFQEGSMVESLLAEFIKGKRGGKTK